ncbi:MAG: methyl-accepting chemotaxis protein [Mycobacterium leprae]
MRLLNPLQWHFGPRTFATLLTWAVVPVIVESFFVWRSFTASATSIGLSSAQISSLTHNMLRTLLYVSVPVLVFCLLAAWLFAWVVVQPLWRLRKAMEEMSKGDLSQGPVPVTSRDEVGQITAAYNMMAANLHNMVQELATIARHLAEAGARLQESSTATAMAVAASERHIDRIRTTAEAQAEQADGGARAMGELRGAAEQVATSAESQSREVGEALETVNHVAKAADQVAQSTGVVAEAAQNTRQAAEAGDIAVDTVGQSMDRVRVRVLAAAEQVRALSDSLTHVDEILQLITDIAGQTDLLALNAAIEAARVGEYGKGFAVVAGEVRRLADRSRTAAGEIATRVEGLRSVAHEVVNTMELGTQEVNHGSMLAKEAGESLNRIRAAVADTQRQVESISAAAEEIAAASNQVVTVTHNLSAIAEENAATSEEMLASSRSVTSIIADVDQKARDNQSSVAPLAAASTQIRGSMDEMVACATQITATSAKLRESVARFRLV